MIAVVRMIISVAAYPLLVKAFGARRGRTAVRGRALVEPILEVFPDLAVDVADTIIEVIASVVDERTSDENRSTPAVSQPPTTRKLLTLAAALALVGVLITAIRTIRKGSATLDDPVKPPVSKPPATTSAPAPVREPEPDPVPEPEVETSDDSPWVLPNDDGSCPISHPVKLKVSSGIFHVEGGGSYERTRADRCYVSAEAAEAEGYRQSLR